MSVMRFGQGVVGHVGVEVLTAASAMMLGVTDFDVARATSDHVPHVVEDSSAGTASETGFATCGARSMSEVPAAANNLGLRQIFGTGNAFCAIGQVFAWA